MNSGISPVNGRAGTSAKQGGRRQVGAWRQQLTRCGRKPTRKRVHLLRVATLRLQAELEYGLRVQGPDTPAARVARRWTKQAEKLRRALSGVRETDVYLQKLDGLRVSVAAPGDCQPRSNRECLRQADELERKLRQLRRASEKRLMAEIEGRRERLDRSSKEMEATFESLTAPAQAVGASSVLEQFAVLAAEFSELDAKSLHAFRKGVKKVRYLAEYLAPADPLAGRLAGGLRRMQSAIGEWHDWQAMGKAASRALKGHSHENSLAELLETLAGESLEKALDLCRRATDQLLEQASRNRPGPQPVVERFPVRRAGSVVAAVERKSA